MGVYMPSLKRVHMPFELLRMVGKHLKDLGAIARFAFASRDLYEFFINDIYKEIADEALVWACSNGDTRTFDLAIKNFQRQRICHEVSTCMKAVHEASKGGHFEMVVAILKMAEGLSRGRWPEDRLELEALLRGGLQKAAKHGHLTIVKELVSRGAYIDSGDPDEKEATPLILAVRGHHLHVCEFLLSKGAFLYACDKSLFNALHVASENGYVEILKLLVAKGGNINIVNTASALKATCLMLAAEKGHATTVTYLLEQEAETERQNRYNETALQIATTERHTKVVEILTDWELHQSTQRPNNTLH